MGSHGSDNSWPSSSRVMIGLVVMLCLARENQAWGSPVIELTERNFDATIASNQVVLVHMYSPDNAGSSLIHPVFHEAAPRLSKSYPRGMVALCQMNAEDRTNKELLARYRAVSTPSFRMFILGEVREGQQDQPGKWSHSAQGIVSTVNDAVATLQSRLKKKRS